jgi:hypothetical protein
MAFPSFLRWLFAPTGGDEAATEDASSIQEQINSTSMASSPTQEDWYWGRLATGGEEDYYWRRLSDNWLQKDVIPSTYLELHNQCYEAYNANPLASAVIEITTSFVLGDTTQHPSHYLFLNLRGTVLIVELPHGDSAHARIYKGPTLFAADADQVPITGEFKVVNGKVEMLVHIQDQTILYVFDGTQFKPQ